MRWVTLQRYSLSPAAVPCFLRTSLCVEQLAICSAWQYPLTEHVERRLNAYSNSHEHHSLSLCDLLTYLIKLAFIRRNRLINPSKFLSTIILPSRNRYGWAVCIILSRDELIAYATGGKIDTSTTRHHHHTYTHTLTHTHSLHRTVTSSCLLLLLLKL